MKKILLTPGPTPVPEEVLLAMAAPILHHRTEEFGEIFSRCLDGLKYVYQTSNEVLVVAASGTGAMEASVVNFSRPDDKVIVASCGNFGERWTKILRAYGINPIEISFGWGQAVDPAEIEKRLKENPEIKAVYTTLTETSTGVVNDIETIGQVVARSEAILVVDAISGLAGDKLLTDEWKVDVAVSGSQKGLMLPPGLAFVSLSPKAINLLETATLPRFYFDFRLMRKSVGTKETPFTPAVSLFVGLDRALAMIKEKGLGNIWRDCEKMARAVRQALLSLGLKLVAERPANIVTAAYLPENIDGGKLVKTLRQEYGISIAGGQGKLKGKIIRLAHTGYISPSDILAGLGALEKVLNNSGYKVSPGISLSRFSETINNV